MMARNAPRGPLAACVVGIALAATAAVAMIVYGSQSKIPAWTLGGVACLVLISAAAPAAIVLALILGRMREVSESARLLEEIRGHAMLSDHARRVLFRDRELQLLRDAIEDHIHRGDYNAAITLCDDLANLFGQRGQAESYRSRIAEAREQHYGVEVQAALDQFEAALAEHDWASVHQQAARIRRLYPDSYQAAEVDHRIEAARAEHKRLLEARFLEAADLEDADAAMSLLKQLDRYLGREEALRLTEVAQGVIVRHRENLGSRFRRSVSERRWSEALHLGESIAAEFPNSQMAAEVRSMMDVLRARAGQPA